MKGTPVPLRLEEAPVEKGADELPVPVKEAPELEDPVADSVEVGADEDPVPVPMGAEPDSEDDG